MPPEPGTQPKPNSILTELENFKKQNSDLMGKVNDLTSLVAKQQNMMLHNHPANPDNPNSVPADDQLPQQFQTMQDMFKFMDSRYGPAATEEAVNAAMRPWASQIMSITKAATGESEVWGKQERANQVMQDNPGLDPDAALRLAEAYITDEQAKTEAQQVESDQLLRDEQRRQDSMGHSGNMSGGTANAPQSRGISPTEVRHTMEKTWDALGMDTLQQAAMNFQDPWGAPGVDGVDTSAITSVGPSPEAASYNQPTISVGT